MINQAGWLRKKSNIFVALHPSEFHVRVSTLHSSGFARRDLELFSLPSRNRLPRNSIVYAVIPDLYANVIPRNDSDEESCRKDFSLPLEMTVWTGFDRLFELLSAKIKPRRHKPLFTSLSLLI